MRLAGWLGRRMGPKRLGAGLAACLFAGMSLGAGAQALPPELQKAWKATRLPLSSLSLEIREAGGPVIARVQADEPRN